MKITTEQMRFWSPSRRELEPYIPGEQPKIHNLLKLNTNENPYPPSPKVVDAVQGVLENTADVLRLYPDPDASELKRAIAQQQNVDMSNVFVGNGSDEVLAHIFKAFFVQDLPLLYADITYSFYPVYSQFFGISTQTKILPLNDDFEIDVADAPPSLYQPTWMPWICRFREQARRPRLRVFRWRAAAAPTGDVALLALQQASQGEGGGNAQAQPAQGIPHAIAQQRREQPGGGEQADDRGNGKDFPEIRLARPHA